MRFHPVRSRDVADAHEPGWGVAMTDRIEYGGECPTQFGLAPRPFRESSVHAAGSPRRDRRPGVVSPGSRETRPPASRAGTPSLMPVVQ